MKITKYLSVLVASAALICSCNDLEQPPTNQYTDANFWSPERAEYMVNTAYSQMYSMNNLFNDEYLSDNMCETRGGGSMEIRKGNALPTSSRFSDEWRSAYQGIKSCHVFLDNIDAQDIPDEEKNHMKAQVRFIRAYLFFRLTNFYGDVPFFTHDILLSEAQTIARTPRADVIRFIHEEMAAIIPDLHTNQEETTGRITKGAAAMLDARAYLYDSDWTNAAAVCKKIMNGEYGHYKLHPSYKALFSEDEEYTKDYNEEVILSRSYVPQVYTWACDMQDLFPFIIGGRTPDNLPLQSLVDNYLMLSGYTITDANTDYNANDPYIGRDPRMTHTIFYDGYDLAGELKKYKDAGIFNADRIVFENGFYLRKHPDAKVTDVYSEDSNGFNRTGYGMRKWFAPQGAKDWNSGLNAIMMRYADVLLMYAEAMNELGQMDANVWNETIRPIRVRAGFTADRALNFPSGSSSDLREIIRNERRSELALEGLRYYDIIRWKAADKYLTGTVKGAPFTTWTDTYQFNVNRDYLWAVPENEYNLNSNLGQNQNWVTPK